MNLDTLVVKKRECLELYMLVKTWPTESMPLVRVCNRWINKAFSILKSIGEPTKVNDGLDAVLLPTIYYPMVAAWLILTYNIQPSQELLIDLLKGTPKSIIVLLNELIALGTSKDDVAIPPRFYQRHHT